MWEIMCDFDAAKYSYMPMDYAIQLKSGRCLYLLQNYLNYILAKY